MTDIDRLHKSIESLGKLSPRRSGKTTAIIHQLAGEVQVGEHKKIFLAINYLRELGYLKKMIKEIFEEQGIMIIKQTMFEIYCHYENGPTKEIIFYSSCDGKVRKIGFKNYSKYKLDY